MHKQFSRESRPRGAARFYRAHGLGNDYLVFEAGTAWDLSEEGVRRVCHRWEGVGSDGIVFLSGVDSSGLKARIFNPDGSEAERSGNGLRVLARYLRHRGRVGREWFPVECGGAVVRMRVPEEDPGSDAEVLLEMGEVIFGSESVALDLARFPADDGCLPPEMGGYPFETVSVGNPHCVVFPPVLSTDELSSLGPRLTTHPAFRDGVNLQLAVPDQSGVLHVLIWERGAGHTFSSGTSSCAAAAAAVRRGLLGYGEIVVRMQGGDYRILVGETFEVTLSGPIQQVYEAELSPSFLALLK